MTDERPQRSPNSLILRIISEGSINSREPAGLLRNRPAGSLTRESLGRQDTQEEDRTNARLLSQLTPLSASCVGGRLDHPLDLIAVDARRLATHRR